jgi:hypothetical protein
VTENPGGRRTRSGAPVAVTLVWLAGSVAAFIFLDPVIASFVAILGLTGVVVTFLSSDWVRASTFEEREAARARRRQEKWDAGEKARERDRARWEAHQARKAGRGER